MECRVKTGHLWELRISFRKSLDQHEGRGHMFRVIGTQSSQFADDLRRYPLWRAVVCSAVYDSMTHRPDSAVSDYLFHPIRQQLEAGGVIWGNNRAALGLFLHDISLGHDRVRQTYSFDLPRPST